MNVVDGGLKLVESCQLDRYGIHVLLGPSFDREKNGRVVLRLNYSASVRGATAYYVEKVPFEHDPSMGLAFGSMASAYYPVGLIKCKTSRYEFQKVMLVDFVRRRVLGVIRIPDGVSTLAPRMCLDREQDALVVVGFDLDFVLAIDTRPYVEKLIAEGKWTRGAAMYTFPPDAPLRVEKEVVPEDDSGREGTARTQAGD